MLTKHTQLKYLNRRLDEMASLEDLLEQKNFPEASRLARLVRGSAPSLRFEGLAELAARLENACRFAPEPVRGHETRAAFVRYRQLAGDLRDSF
ncbi:MAG: Hpt domain-containing protein [Bdellovibrionaceae bacterium]|nr:Hpt domain-containing protein [Pseudobdellovibrionaceae bacterium]